jgi:hypothetical protein
VRGAGQAEEAKWPSKVQKALAAYQQGDLFDGLVLTYFGNGSLPWAPSEVVEEPDADPDPSDFELIDLDFHASPAGYGVITTQTCDLCEEGVPAQPCFQAAPAYRLVEVDNRQALPGYLVSLEPPDLPAGRWVADLRIEVPVEKSFLVGRGRFAGFPDEAGYLDFAAALGRRCDRAALAPHLVDAVAATLNKRISNNKKFRRTVRDQVQSVRLAIERGTRFAPADVRVHVVIRGDVEQPEDVRERFESWWDTARSEAEKAGITLLPNRYHDSLHMDVELYDALIPLHLGP